jgi:hypothetical protein
MMRKDVTVEDRTRAIRRAVREAVLEHALLGHSVSVWRDGKVVWLSPEEIFEELRTTIAECRSGKSQESND